MAGWTYTGAVIPVGVRGRPDGGEKVEAFPALGAAVQVGWWQEFAYATGREFTRLCKMNQPNVATVKVSADNSTGDTAGVGTLTITIITT